MAHQLTSKPTLHEIAALPYSKTIIAIRQFYDPKFGIAGPLDEGAIEFSVSIDWSYRCDKIDQFTVRADSLAEAKEKAKQVWEDDFREGDDAEIDHIAIREFKSQ